VFEPKHIGPDGSLEVGALQDVSTNGLSTQRRRSGDAERLREQGLAIAKIQNERAQAAVTSGVTLETVVFRGIVELPVAEVRSHCIQGRRSFCVMDSAGADNPLHADIIIDGQRSKAERSKLRNELRRLIVSVKPKSL
jgi:hypothetical protein